VRKLVLTLYKVRTYSYLAYVGIHVPHLIQSL